MRSSLNPRPGNSLKAYHAHSPVPRPGPCKRVFNLAGQSSTRYCSTRTKSLASEGAYGIWLEVDKVVIDAHMSAHRVAFNRAFKELGHRSIKWTPELFWQLLRSAAASPVSLLQTYFNTVGWPSNIKASDHEGLVARIQNRKDECLADMVEKADIPLRTGVQDFLRSVPAESSISLLAGTCSAKSEGLVEAALTGLGPDIAERCRIFQAPSPETAAPPADDPDAIDFSKIQISLQAATAQKKLEEAQAFMETVNNSKMGKDWRDKTAASEPGQINRFMGEGMMIDPGLLASMQRFSSLSPAWLAACATTTGVGMQRSAMLGGSNSVLRAAQGAGMLSIAVPTSFSGRGTFSGADAVMDSYGAGGGVTWARLSRKIDAGRPKPRTL